uniref:Uncharacterized protein n=1 Tax=Anguilla anguilla TaxID=7936 RepID=A0A0E9WSB7_ANGAN
MGKYLIFNYLSAVVSTEPWFFKSTSRAGTHMSLAKQDSRQPLTHNAILPILTTLLPESTTPIHLWPDMAQPFTHTGLPQCRSRIN